MQTIELDDTHFETIYQKTRNLFWLDFWGEECDACETVSSWIEHLPERFAHQVTIGKINVYRNEGLVKRFGITRIPTLLFLVEGQEKHRQTAQLSETDLHQLLDSLLNTV